MIVSGSLVEFQLARKELLEKIITKYSSRKLNGYIVYSTLKVHLIIGLVEGSIASCRAIVYTSTWRRLFGRREQKKIIDGAECCEFAVRYLRDRSGVILVYESTRDAVMVNINNTPTARVESNVGFISLLGLSAGMTTSSIEQAQIKLEKVKPIMEPASSEFIKPRHEPLPSTHTLDVKPREEPIKTHETPIPVKEEPRSSREVKFSSECIDPTQLFYLIKTSEFVEAINNIEVDKALDVLMLISSLRKADLVYARGIMQKSPIRILYNARTNTVHVEMELMGEIKCGEHVLSALKEKKIEQLHVLISR